MAARFTQGTSTATTRSIRQESRVPIARGSGKGHTGGLPGYIKTAQDKSSSGLANPAKARGRQNTGPRREGAIPSRPGESRRDWQSASSTGGSQDVSYFKTSTDKAGVIRKMGEPKAPAKRSNSQMETSPGGTTGSRTAVSNGGVHGANKLPPEGISADRTGKKHITGSGHRGLGSAKASGQNAAARGGWKTSGRESSIGNKAPPTAKGFIGGAKGTMESLKGRVNTTQSMGMGKRSGSQMY